MLGRFSGNKFGIILNNCTPDDMAMAAERLLAGVRDDVVQTGAGPVAVTVTIGGVTAPRHARTVQEILARAQETLDRAKAKRPRLVPRLPAERRARGAAPRERARRPTRSSPRSTSGASCSPSSRWSTTQSRAAGLLRMPDAHPPRRRHAGAGAATSFRSPSSSAWCACSTIACSSCWSASWRPRRACNASVNVSPASTTDPDWWTALGALLRAQSRRGRAAHHRDHRDRRDPRHRRDPRLRRARQGSRLPHRDRRFRRRLHLVPQSAQARRRHHQDRRRLRAEPDAHRRTTAPSCTR